MALTPGQVLQNGKYTIERELGRGRFGITYLAKRSDGERWVIKILNPSVLAALSPAERDRLETMFWQEAVKLEKCSGTPHIVKTAMPFKEGPIVCLPMEYVSGQSLADRAEPKLLEETALEYVRQIGEALAVVHQKGLVHCDIRPANIFLKLQGKEVKAILTDFGLALSCDAELTRTRTKERSDGFSPIELYSRGQPVGPYTDVYSLAATLYELLTGEVPVSAGDRKLGGSELISPRGKNPEISGKTTKAILSGMALMPKKRPQTIDEWLKQLPALPSPVTAIPDSKVNWSKWQTYWGAAGVLVTLLGVLVTLLVGIPAWLAIKPPEKPSIPAVSPKAPASPK
jgi:eukaryotic-like serine/threonine-protein kinase